MLLSFLVIMCSKIVYILIVLVIKENQILAQQFNNPASDLSRHKIAQATVFHARTKRELSSTRHSGGLHHPEVLIKIKFDPEDYVLDLRLNEELISEDHVISYQEDGKTVQHKPSIEELDICQYSGVVRDKPDSWAAVSTCQGVRGVIYDGQRMRHITPAEGDEISSNHIIYDHLDLNKAHKCGFDASADVTNNTNYDPDLLLELNHSNMNNTRHSRHKREAFGTTEPHGPYKSNYLSRYVELVLVADHRFYKTHGKDIHKVNNRLRDVTNIINSMYSPLNIYITLVGVVVWNDQDEIRISSNSLETLENFLEYRRTRLDIKNDNAHLITMQRFDENIVGKADEGVMCTYKASGGIASHDRDSDIDSLAFTITHEMGHNFGMSHDEDKICTCVEKQCIMTTTLRRTLPTHWSSCSLRSLARAFDRGAEYCLRNKPKHLFRSPTCGNGFVEYGEQCDCGNSGSRAERKACRSCCDPRTCRFRRNATCASGECCNLETCRPMSAGTVCRSALKECDLPEHCNGHSEFCPADVFKMDSTPCGTHREAYCAGGSCKSHSTQCRLLWGPTSNSSHLKCYRTYNAKGNEYGNCGYHREKDQYVACASEDVLCGRLQCQRMESLRFGNENYAVLKAAFETDRGKLLQCNAAHVDLGVNDVDPGLVPDGAKCGDDKMCFKQRCRPVAEIRAGIAVCPNDCNGRGICNSKGHCHCNTGFAPPDCAAAGPGGSYDSGPTTKSKKAMIDSPTNVKPAPRPERPDHTNKPEPRRVGPTNIRPVPRFDRPEDTTKPEDPKQNRPTSAKPVYHPTRPDGTTKPKDPRRDGPTNIRPHPRSDRPKSEDPKLYRPTSVKPVAHPKRPDDTTKPKVPGGDRPPVPRAESPDDTTKPKVPRRDGPINFRPVPSPERPDDTTKPEDPKRIGPPNVEPAPRRNGSGDTTESNDSNSVGPTYVKPAPQPDGLVNTTSEITTDPNAQRDLMVTIYVIFLGIVPLILIVLFVIYFRKLKDIFCSNESRTLSSDFLKRRVSNNCNSFFTKFPKISVDASSHRVYFNYNNTIERVNPASNVVQSEICSRNNTNVNSDFSQCGISPVNISHSYAVINKSASAKKTARENVINNNRDTTALIENVKNDNVPSHIHPIKPPPPPPPKPKKNATRVIQPHTAASAASNIRLSNADQTVKEKVCLYPTLVAQKNM